MKKALKLNVPIIYLNMVGGQDELVFDGGSFVVNDLGEIIYQASSFKEEVKCCINLDQAVNIAIQIGIEKEAKSLLFSPACASFDQYKDYEERGEHFRSLIEQLLSF